MDTLIFSRKLLAAGSAAPVALTAGSALAAGDTLPNGRSRYGSPTAEVQSAHAIDVVGAETLNVRCGESVSFVNGAEKFSWRFHPVNPSVVQLAKIVPADFGPVGIKVYVSRNNAENRG